MIRSSRIDLGLMIASVQESWQKQEASLWSELMRMTQRQMSILGHVWALPHRHCVNSQLIFWGVEGGKWGKGLAGGQLPALPPLASPSRGKAKHDQSIWSSCSSSLSAQMARCTKNTLCYDIHWFPVTQKTVVKCNVFQWLVLLKLFFEQYATFLVKVMWNTTQRERSITLNYWRTFVHNVATNWSHWVWMIASLSFEKKRICYCQLGRCTSQQLRCIIFLLSCFASIVAFQKLIQAWSLFLFTSLIVYVTLVFIHSPYFTNPLVLVQPPCGMFAILPLFCFANSERSICLKLLTWSVSWSWISCPAKLTRCYRLNLVDGCLWENA